MIWCYPLIYSRLLGIEEEFDIEIANEDAENIVSRDVGKKNAINS